MLSPRRVVDRYRSDKQAGGLIPENLSEADAIKALRAIRPQSLRTSDLVHATYVLDYLAGGRARVKPIASDYATAYAQEFAEWLGYVFLNRANLTRKSQVMKDLEEGLGNWVESIPNSLAGSPKMPTDFLSGEAKKFLDPDKVNKLGEKILRVVKGDYERSDKTAREGVDALPIRYNDALKRYEIPLSQLTYANRKKLRDLGFEYSPTCWWSVALDSKVLEFIPQAAQIERTVAAPVKADPAEWFFDTWLPQSLDRFANAFNSYARQEGVPYSFKFTLVGREVNVQFQRDIKTVSEAIAELRSRYGDAGDREGWMTAVSCYEQLMRATGEAAMHVIDKANNLEHSHGAMMEHFPPGIASWYPRFLDFKYTAHVRQMIKAIKDEDLRVCLTELLPDQLHMDRTIGTPRVDHRTPKGLILEVTSQQGKARKKQKLREVLKEHPDLAMDIMIQLDARGIDLGVRLEDIL